MCEYDFLCVEKSENNIRQIFFTVICLYGFFFTVYCMQFFLCELESFKCDILNE